MTGRAQRAAVVIARRMGRAGLSGRGGRRTTDGPARRSFSRQRFTRGGRIEDDRLQAQKQGLREIGMPDSGIVDLGLGLAFVFGVTAAIGSVATELIARLLGLRGAYLLSRSGGRPRPEPGRTPARHMPARAPRPAPGRVTSTRRLARPRLRMPRPGRLGSRTGTPKPGTARKIRRRPARCSAARSCGVRGWPARSPAGS